jgi:hypothetical protein
LAIALIDSCLGGLFIGVGTGIKRVLIAPKEATLKLIPVDICVNGMIVAVWKKWRDEKILQMNK